MCKRLYLVIVLVGLGIVMSAGVTEAAFTVENLGRLTYWTNIAQIYRYDETDTAYLRVLWGPQMDMQKSLVNNTTGETSYDGVKVARGDTVSFYLYAANHQPNADTTAYHVILVDTFAEFVKGNKTAKVGPWESLGSPRDSGNSFTYVAGAEAATLGDSYCTPTYIAYYDYTDEQWEGQGGAVVNITNPFDPNWITYDTGNAWENQVNGGGGNEDYICGICWYWNRVYCWKDHEGTLQDKPYKVQVEFMLQKNDN